MSRRLPQRTATLIAVVSALSAHAQTPPDSLRSTLSGVYVAEQAAKGKDVYLGQCQSCHTPAAFAGAEFRTNWGGKLLSEFFSYLVESMPESEPGSLSKDQYAQVTAYILQLNSLPTGAAALPVDADSLKAIKLELPPGSTLPYVAWSGGYISRRRGPGVPRARHRATP